MFFKDYRILVFSNSFPQAIVLFGVLTLEGPYRKRDHPDRRCFLLGDLQVALVRATGIATILPIHDDPPRCFSSHDNTEPKAEGYRLSIPRVPARPPVVHASNYVASGEHRIISAATLSSGI